MYQWRLYFIICTFCMLHHFITLIDLTSSISGNMTVTMAFSCWSHLNDFILLFYLGYIIPSVHIVPHLWLSQHLKLIHHCLLLFYSEPLYKAPESHLSLWPYPLVFLFSVIFKVFEPFDLSIPPLQSIENYTVL